MLQRLGQTTVTRLAEETGVTRKTAKSRLMALVNAGHAVRWRETERRSHIYSLTLPVGVTVQETHRA
jgi:DNA-binding MarR family transcriptional regulator